MRLPTEDEMPILLVVELLGGACCVHLWRTAAPLWKKLLWTPVILLPVLGPLLYGSVFRAPKPHEEDATPTVDTNNTGFGA
jgi:hypothetical protein